MEVNNESDDDSSVVDTSEHSTNRSDAHMEFESEIVDSSVVKQIKIGSTMGIGVENTISLNNENGSNLGNYFGAN